MTYPLAVQLYTLRHLSSDVRELIEVVADAGYAGVEGGYGPEVGAEELRDVLGMNGVKMVSVHVLPDVLEADLKDVVASQRTLNNSVIVIPWISSENYSDNAESWQRLGERFQKIAQNVKDEGMTLLYHNHSFEFGRYDGSWVWSIF